MIRVLLADDQKLIRAGFRALLDAEENIDVVGEAANGQEAIELARELLPDVVLLDIQMPVMDGIEATAAIAADPKLAAVHVVILTNFGLDEYVFSALRAGAAGFLLKDTDPGDLVHAVGVVMRGDALLSPGITRRLISEFVTRPPLTLPPGEANLLTAREREAVALVARGLTNAEIAQSMVVSPFTAKTHVSRAMTKLGARDRAQLVVFAYESGLVRAKG
ncbi:response regulator transcription factor [Nonomuraea sp. NPDC055795]